MSPVFASRRRAEEFASLVEGARTGTARDAGYAEFLSIVADLRDVPTPEPRPEFVGTLREQLMAAADTMLVPTEPERLALPARTPARDRKLAAAIGGFAVVGASTSMALAAQSALPGEMLYPLKRVIENAEIGLTSEADVKAMTLLENATSRLAEIAALDREGELAANASAAETTLVDFREQATEGSTLLLDEYARTGDPRLIRALQAFTAESLDTLAQLEPVVPAAARDELMAAARALTRIDARAEQACPSCGSGIGNIPSVLLASTKPEAPATVVVPGTTLAAPLDRTKPADRNRDRPARNDGGATTTAAPADQQADQPIDPTSVVPAPEGGTAGTGGGTGGGDDPVSGLSGALGGAGTSTSTSGGSGVLDPQVDESIKQAGETIDATVDGLTAPLTD